MGDDQKVSAGCRGKGFHLFRKMESFINQIPILKKAEIMTSFKTPSTD